MSSFGTFDAAAAAAAPFAGLMFHFFFSFFLPRPLINQLMEHTISYLYERVATCRTYTLSRLAPITN